jgi:hypothetical protein
MSEALQSVLSAAMSLPPNEREVLRQKIIGSLPPPDGWEEIDEKEFFAELVRRRQECLDRIDPGISMADVRAAIAQELDD